MYKLISDTTLPDIGQLNVQIEQDKTISTELEKLYLQKFLDTFYNKV